MKVARRAPWAGVRKPPKEETAEDVAGWCVRRYGDYMSGGTVKPFLPLLLRFLLFDRAAGFLPPRP
jgi:hypothetical protein